MKTSMLGGYNSRRNPFSSCPRVPFPKATLPTKVRHWLYFHWILLALIDTTRGVEYPRFSRSHQLPDSWLHFPLQLIHFWDGPERSNYYRGQKKHILRGAPNAALLPNMTNMCTVRQQLTFRWSFTMWLKVQITCIRDVKTSNCRLLRSYCSSDSWSVMHKQIKSPYQKQWARWIPTLVQSQIAQILMFFSSTSKMTLFVKELRVSPIRGAKQSPQMASFNACLLQGTRCTKFYIHTVNSRTLQATRSVIASNWSYCCRLGARKRAWTRNQVKKNVNEDSYVRS